MACDDFERPFVAVVELFSAFTITTFFFALILIIFSFVVVDK